MSLTTSISSANAETLDFTPCALTGSNGNGTLQAECAVWPQPLDRANPNSPNIELFVSRLKATALAPAKDAFTLVNGGPGGSSIDMLVDLAAVAQLFTRERDVIVIDQRGTGRSTPLTCDAVTDQVEEYSEEDTLRLTFECLAGLPFDPRFFTTSAAVEDLDALRQALGYEQLSLYGVSYGTRVVQHYMRTYPAQTRVAVIDGVIPTTQALGPQIAIHSQNALEHAIARCAETESCAQAFPNLREELATVAAELQENPKVLSIQHPVTGKQTEMQVRYPHFMMWLRFSLYATETTALIPLTIHQVAADQNYLPIASNVLRMLHNITTSLNYGMHNAVICTEDTPFYEAALVDYAAMDQTYIGRQVYDLLNTMCDIWPEGVRHTNIKDPLSSDTPTLVLSGEFDPITPPAWGEVALQGLSNAVHIVAPGQGHGTIGRGCIPKMILEFVESADPSQVNKSCIEHLGPYPFFVNPMGPPP